MRVLLLEDDDDLADELVEALRDFDFSVDRVGTLADADVAIAVTEFDCLVLDRTVPDGDAVDLLQGLRDDGNGVPVLLLTARDRISDRVAGFESGADDYLVKPFAFAELVMRIRALTRRRPHLRPTTLEAAGIRLDSATHRVWRDGVQLLPTSKEFAVLEMLMEHAGDAVSRSRLIEHCWDEASEPSSNVVDVLVGQLRRRLGAPDPITTIRGVGYRFER